MDRASADALAFAMMRAMVWAARGANPLEIPIVHQELADALCGAPAEVVPIARSDGNLVREAEQHIFDSALDFTNGHPGAAAKLLGISRSTMYRHTRTRKRVKHAESPAPSAARARR